MEKFDIDYFREKMKDNPERSFTEIRNDTIIEMTEYSDLYKKEIRHKNSPFKNAKAYYGNNYQLKAETNYFYYIPIGISYKYNEKGELIEERNHDYYSFSVEQLIDKMKKEYGIDLLDKNYKGVLLTNTEGGKRHYYIIRILLYPPNVRGGSREIRVDANTGEVFLDMNKGYSGD